MWGHGRGRLYRGEQRVGHLGLPLMVPPSTPLSTPPPSADANGTIHGWAEANLNTTSPLRYDRSRKEFTVVKRGLYYLYCQVRGKGGADKDSWRAF